MMQDVKRGLAYTVVTMTLFGGGYPLLVWGLGRVLFPHRASGSLIQRVDGNGTIVGSALIAQKFERPQYFHPRPSGVDYDAASTGGTNYGPSNADHLSAVKQRLAVRVAQDGVEARQVPSEMVTASGAGLDPHVPVAAAEQQVAHVASSRGVDPARVRELVVQHTAPPTLGIFGRARVNVLELNLAVDAAFGPAGKESVGKDHE